MLNNATAQNSGDSDTDSEDAETDSEDECATDAAMSDAQFLRHLAGLCHLHRV
jgi:hypothetical protein